MLRTARHAAVAIVILSGCGNGDAGTTPHSDPAATGWPRIAAISYTSGRPTTTFTYTGDLPTTIGGLAITYAGNVPTQYGTAPLTYTNGRLTAFHAASTSYTYDAQGRLATRMVTWYSNGAVINAGGATWTYTYTGALVTGCSMDMQSTLGNASETYTYRYDANGLLQAIETIASGTVELQYGADHRVTRILFDGGVTDELTYDADGRVATDVQPGETVTYSYGAGVMEGLRPVVGSGYTCDVNGRPVPPTTSELLTTEYAVDGAPWTM